MQSQLELPVSSSLSSQGFALRTVPHAQCGTGFNLPPIAGFPTPEVFHLPTSATDSLVMSQLFEVFWFCFSHSPTWLVYI